MPPLVDSRRDCQSSGADRRHARWQLLPDELWAHIATFMGTYDKMVRFVADDARRTSRPNCSEHVNSLLLSGVRQAAVACASVVNCSLTCGC